MILLYRCIQINVAYRKKERKTYVYMHSHMCGSVRRVLFRFLVHGSYWLGKGLWLLLFLGSPPPWVHPSNRLSASRCSDCECVHDGADKPAEDSTAEAGGMCHRNW